MVVFQQYFKGYKMDCMTQESFFQFIHMLNVQSMDWFGAILVVGLEDNINHVYHLVNDKICMIRN